jgi:purine-nucleoside phosphorylase
MTSIDSSFASLQKLAPDAYAADIAIILGSGLNQLLDSFEILQSINYQQLEGFPHSTAPGHKGCLHIARHQGKNLLVFEGRLHMYEGWTAQQAAMPVRLAGKMGAKQIIMTNAVGALNPEFCPGDVMLVNDHINFTGASPLIGVNDDSIGLRFPDMSRAYNRSLYAIAETVFKQKSIALREGIYAGVFGPELETSAERRFFRLAGADAIGMSLVMETIAAVHGGMHVLALAAITNSATGGEDQQPDSIEEVMQNAAISAQKITQALPTIIERIDLDQNRI